MKAKLLLKQKRTWVIAGALVLVITGATLWLVGAQRQQSSFSASTRREAQVERLADTVYSDKSSREARVKAISELSQLKLKSVCKSDWWNNWQQDALAHIKKQADECVKKERAITLAADSAAAAKRHIDDENRIITQLNTLTVDKAAKDWPQKAENNARAAQKAVDSIRVISSVQPVLKASKERLAAIVNAWSALGTASENKDKTAYLVAEAQLKQSYVDIAAVTDVSDTQLRGVISNLQKATQHL